MTETVLIRAAFVDSQTVTADQWAKAALATGADGWRATLTALTKQPAWWAADGSAFAVTDFHIRVVDALRKAGSLDPLARRLRWGHYLIRGELGRGGMGVVYRAWDVTARTDVALKRVRGSSKQARTRFRREGEILSRLDHPAVAQFLGVERLDGGDVLVMEFVPGESAARKVRRMTREGRCVPWKTAVGWAVEVLDALAHAHGRQVIHRDIKPGNLMITGVGGSAVKLLDMGLAKCTELPDGGGELTLAGQILGTSEYMPPEQWTGGKTVTAAADLYALGGTLYFLLTGRCPFPGDSPHQQMIGHLSGNVPSVRATRADVPEALDAIVRRMMAKNPLHRGTARELRWQLNTVLATGGDSGDVEAAISLVEAPESTPRSSASDVRAGSQTLAAAGASTAVTPRVWPLFGEMATEFKRLVGLAPRRRESVFDESPLSRLGTLGVALAVTVWDKATGRRAVPR